nr:hypothetical protein CFP56_16703 [Quercus suber]
MMARPTTVDELVPDIVLPPGSPPSMRDNLTYNIAEARLVTRRSIHQNPKDVNQSERLLLVTVSALRPSKYPKFVARSVSPEGRKVCTVITQGCSHVLWPEGCGERRWTESSINTRPSTLANTSVFHSAASTSQLALGSSIYTSPSSASTALQARDLRAERLGRCLSRPQSGWAWRFWLESMNIRRFRPKRFSISCSRAELLSI